MSFKLKKFNIVNSKNTMEDRPLVSFCLMSCRQKELIREAFTAALAQDYDNLEIIVSDDNSQDGTWKIVRQIADEYKGPHKVILNRNEPNLGTIGNWQKLCSLASGEILIKADGDDVSYPDRASCIVEDWISSGRKAMVMASSYDKMDEGGNITGEVLLPGGWDKRTTAEIVEGEHYFYLGATIACHRSLFDDFPLVTFTKSSDCGVYEARGLLSGMCVKGAENKGDVFCPFRTISRKLVKYRIGSGDTTGGTYRKFMAKGIRRTLEARKQILSDLENCAKNYLPVDYYNELHELYGASKARLENVIKLWDGETFSERLEGYGNIKHSGFFNKKRLIETMLLLPKGVSNAIFALLRH